MDIDARGPRFGAAVTTAVLAAALITQNPWVLGWQAFAFAVGVAAGVPRSPYGWAFRTAVRPRLGPPKEFEPPQPPRFAQAVGLVFACLGLVGFTLGPAWLGLAATAAALAAAFLNAAFGYCLGCEMFLLLKRATVRTE
jgi:FtsH-binding integral membrane protein